MSWKAQSKSSNKSDRYQEMISSGTDSFISVMDGADLDITGINTQQTTVNTKKSKLTRHNTLKTLKQLWLYMWDYKVQVILVLVTTIIAVGFNCLAAFATIYLTDLLARIDAARNIGGDNLSALLSTLSILAVVILIFYFIYAFGVWLQTRVMAIVSQKVGYKIREDLFDKIQKLPVKYFDQNSSGDLMSKFTNDVNNVTNMFSQNSAIILNGITTILAMIISMFLLSPYMALIVIGCTIILIIPILFVSKRSEPHFKKMQETLGEVNGFIEEMISGQSVISLYDQGENTLKGFSKINNKLISVTCRGQQLTSFILPYLIFALNVITTIVWLVGIVFTIEGVGVGFTGITMVDILQLGNDTVSQASAGIALTAAFSVMARQFFLPFTQIGGIANVFLMALAGADRAFNVFKETNEINSTERLILSVVDSLNDGERFPSTEDTQRVKVEVNGEMVKLSDVAHSIETNSSIIVKDLDFGYYKDKQILYDINLDVKKGQTIAIVGPTGSGKSTFINLLTKFYDLGEKGDILFGNNVSIKRITKKSMRDNVSIVLQDTFLFNISIKENIRYGNTSATDEQVIQAAKTANAHNFIMQLPNGYDTVLRDNGEDLSQGERQLLAIARALLSPSNILILDEATSSIDTKTEIQIQNAMLQLMKNKTSFVIAHRLSTIQNADQIIVIKDGHIIERGTHQELIDLKKFYYDLYNSQFYED